MTIAPVSYLDGIPLRTSTRLRTWHLSPTPTGGEETPHDPNKREHHADSSNDTISKDILVVEDESYLCELISDVLEAEGHVARKASNGLEALDRLRERKPQLILLDLMMPIMDGWEFMEALRSNPEWDGVPVVIITAIYDVKRTQEETGAKAVITKPFDIDQITEIVRAYAL